MATYYTIHCYDQESKYHVDEDLINNHILYNTFERACEAIEERIRYYDSDFQSPNREDKAKYISKSPYVHYYEANAGVLFVISKMTVEEEKPKKYVYQYWVENKICGLHTKSGKYASFDEVCDALDMELRELHENPDWKPRMSREEFKDYMADYWVSTYDFFKEDKYVLSRQEAS